MSTTHITVRVAQTPADYAAAFALVNELAAYEKAAHEVTLTLEQFIADGQGSHPLYQLRVAEISGLDNNPEPQIAGMALFYTMYSTWKGKIVYLDDVVVQEKYRRYGIGQHLMNTVLDYARTQNAAQVRWHVLDWNTPAIRFYEKMQVRLEPEWITCKMDKELLFAPKNN